MKYEAQDRQKLFHFADADEVLYGGAAGGGKSYAIIWDAVDFCLSNEGVRAAIFRRTYPELEKSIIYEFLNKIPPDWYEYNKKSRRVTFNDTGSVLEFNYVQYDQDVVKYQSAQYDRLYFDELTHFTRHIYIYLLSRLRTTKDDLTPQVKSATNPGGVGHSWVKERFINYKGKKVEREKKIERYDEETDSYYTTQFIPAKVKDNEYLVKNDNYINQLKKLPEDERKALLHGDWDVFKGQFFKEWRRNKHVVEPFPIPPDWKLFRAMDWGYRNPAVVLWIAMDYDGKLWVYRELYETEHTTEMIANKMVDMTPSHEKIQYTIADPSMWSRTQYEKGESIAASFISNNIPLIKGDNDRVSGASAIRKYLRLREMDDSGEKKPMLAFFKTCYNTIEEIPALVHDRKKPEDVDTDGDDHAYDALRYGVMAHPMPPTIEKVTNTKKDSFQYHFEKMKRKRAFKEGVYVGNI